MTPKQIANNLALIALADMDNPQQATAATAMLTRTIPHLRDALVSDVETAGLDQPTILAAYTDLIHTALFGGDLDTSDNDILQDNIADEEDEDDKDNDDANDLAPGLDSANLSLLDGAAMLRELAAGEIRNKGKFIPLDEIDVVDQIDGEQASPRLPRTAPAAEHLDTTPRRRNVFGKLAAKA